MLVQLEIRRSGDDAVDGVLVSPGARVAFSGWLDLLRLLESALDAPLPAEEAGAPAPPVPSPRPERSA